MFNSTKEVEFPLKVLHDKNRRKIPTGIGMISTSEKGIVDANPPLEAPSLGGGPFHPQRDMPMTIRKDLCNKP